MKKPAKLSAVLLIAVLMVGLLGAIPGAAANQPSHEMVNVLVAFKGKPDTGLVKRFGGQVNKEFSLIPVVAAKMSSSAASALAKNPNVSYVEPDFEVQALQTIPWGINRVFGAEGYPFETWSTSKGSGIKVAVLDTGIDQSHVDLNVVGGTNTVDGTHWGSDGYGHGTHVAGTVAALDNGSSGAGVVGVAPQVDLYSVKVLNDSGGGSISSVVGGIQWAVTQKIPVMNMSLGSSSYSQTLKDACDVAYNSGHLLVAAAGNSGNKTGNNDTVSYPAKHDSVIAVAASDSSDKRATWSSTGPAVELIAPGVSILSTLPGSKYGTMSGTSMASPHVAGIAALVWAANPGLTNASVRDILRTTAENLGLSANHQGYGLARADLAVAKASKLLPVATGSIEGTVSDTNGTPIQGAIVKLEGTDIAITTGVSGYYLLEGVPVESYILKASAEGYYSETSSVPVEQDAKSVRNFALSPIPVYSVSGTVTDLESGEVIAGATVTIQETGQSATTGTDGLYAITGLMAGTYTITISSAGYDNQTKTVTVESDTVENISLGKVTEVLVDAMYVSGISFSEKRYGRDGSTVDLTVIVEVLNSSNNQPISGASVKMILNHSSGSWSFNGSTADNGKVAFTLKRVSKGGYTATIDSLVHTGFDWDKSNDNNVTSATHTVN